MIPILSIIYPLIRYLDMFWICLIHVLTCLISTVSPMNMTKEHRLTMEGIKPVAVFPKLSTKKAAGGQYKTSVMSFQKRKVQLVQQGIHYLFEGVRRACDGGGLNLVTGDGKGRRVLPLLGLYTCDGEELNKLVGMVGGNCPYCDIPKDQIGSVIGRKELRQHSTMTETLRQKARINSWFRNDDPLQIHTRNTSLINSNGTIKPGDVSMYMYGTCI